MPAALTVKTECEADWGEIRTTNVNVSVGVKGCQYV